MSQGPAGRFESVQPDHRDVSTEISSLARTSRLLTLPTPRDLGLLWSPRTERAAICLLL